VRASLYEVLRARVERTNQEPPQIQARSDRELALLEVKRLLNIPVDQPLVLTSALDADALQAFVARVANDSSADPVRASVRAAESVLEARREGVRVARADLMPTVSAFFQTGYLALPSNNGVPTVWGETSAAFCPPGSPPTRVCQNNGWFPDRNFGVQIQWPLFDGLRAKGNIDLAQAQRRVAELQLAQEREQVAVERAEARAEFARARAAYEAQRDNVREAEEAYRLAALRFERGLDTQLDASAVQLQLLVAQTNEARSIFDLYIAAADLARAGTAHPAAAHAPGARPDSMTSPFRPFVPIASFLRASAPYATALAVLLAASGCSGGADDGPPVSAAAAATKTGPRGDASARDGGGARRSASIILAASDVKTVERGAIEAGVAVSGDLRAIEEAVVRARIEGDLVGVYAREGDHVREGQLLARFESSEQESDRASALADRESAQTDLQTAEWNAEQSEQLFKAGAIAERDLRAAHQALSAARARVAAAEARVRATSSLVTDTRVLAPTTGVVAERLVENGEHVARGASMFTVVRSDVLELAAAVPARQANEIRVGQRVHFATAGRDFDGRVARVSPTIDPANRSVTVYVQVPNASGTLKGNSFATGRVVFRTVDSAIVIPVTALRQAQGNEKPFVYRLDAADALERAPVSVGIVDDAQGIAEIVEGLAPGDRIIVGNVGALGAGMKVTIAGGGEGGSRRPAGPPGP
jgi:RND family efflux transporter MFP subunit